MGHDATINVPSGINKKEIEELLILLDYQKVASNVFFHYVNKNYLSKTGVSAKISSSETENCQYEIWIRTQIWANNYDIEVQNNTLRKFKKYLNCSFTTDLGSNRYFQKYEKEYSNAENGIYYAYNNLHNLFTNIKYFLQEQKTDSNPKAVELSIMTGIPTPNILCANISLSYLCSILEYYFRETYIALLKFSSNKESIYKNSKIPYSDLQNVCDYYSIDDIIGYNNNF